MFAEANITPATQIPIGWALSGVVATSSLVFWVASKLQKIQDDVKHIKENCPLCGLKGKPDEKA